MQRAAVYRRVSTAEQAAGGESLGVQLRRCTEHCERNGYVVVGHYQDVMSGRRAGRPAYQQMLAACRRGEVDVVVVQFLDRLGRNLREASRCWDELEDLGVALEAADQPVPKGPEGKLVRYMMGWMAERESERIGERVRGAILHKLERGEHWARVPFGWHRDEDGRLVVYEPEAATVREMVRLSQAGYGAQSIAQRLNAVGHRRRPHALMVNPLWTANAVRKVLSRARNAGSSEWGAAGRRANKDGRKPAVTAEHVAIVSAEEHAAALDAALLRRTRPSTRMGESPFLLAGLLRCGACSYPLVGNMSKNPRAHQWAYFYCCRGHRERRPGGCEEYRYYNAGRLHEAVLTVLIPHADAIAARAQVPRPETPRPLDLEEAGLRRELEQVGRELRRQYDLYSRGIIDEGALAELGREFTMRRAAAEQRLAAIQAEREAEQRRAARIIDLPRKARDLVETFDTLDRPGRKALLQELIERVTVYPDRRIDVEFRL